MTAARWMTIREAWHCALYASGGFYSVQMPRDHFRTSVHASGLFAEALLTYVRRAEVSAVVDLGAGGGEFLAQLQALEPNLTLTGVDVRERPASLGPNIGWRRVNATDTWSDVITDATERTLVLANELLDNIPCEVVELDDRGTVRLVEIDIGSGVQRLGTPASDSDVAWLARWWPLDRTGQRAEVGTSRETVWRAACDAVADGICLAVDYGHVRHARPVDSTLTSYRRGRQLPAAFDGAHDVTAHVAIDALADVVQSEACRQRDMLQGLGITGSRPEVAMASSAPTAYLRALARAGEAAELTASPGLGDFWWVVTSKGQSVSDARTQAGID